MFEEPQQLELLDWDKKSTASSRPAPPTSPPTLDELRHIIRTDKFLSVTKRRDFVSALNRAQKLFGLRSKQMINATLLRPHLASKPPNSTGIKPKTWSNLRSSLQAIVNRYLMMRGQSSRQRLPRSLEWDALLAKIAPEDSRYRLSRFINYCSNSGVKPSEVNEKTLSDFEEELNIFSVSKNPTMQVRATICHWNKQARAVSDWPNFVFASRATRKPYTFLWSDLPSSLTADAEIWLKRCETGGDPFDDIGPIKPARPITIEAKRFQIRQAASILVAQGVHVRSLADLVSPGNLLAVVTFLRERSGTETSSQIENMVGHMLCIARHHVCAEEHMIKKLANFARRTRNRKGGMTPKNEKRIGQFRDKRSSAALITLPLDIVDRYTDPKVGGHLQKRPCIELRNAAAVEVLLMAPMRLKNLAGLNLDKHVEKMESGGNSYWIIRIPADEDKNNQILTFRIPPRSVVILDAYIKMARPYLIRGRDAGWLFPGAKLDKPINSTVLGRAIGSFIRCHTGLIMNAHLFRHFAAYLLMDKHPEAYEAASRLLGHTSSRTARESYVGHGTESLQKKYAAIVFETAEFGRMTP